MVNHLRKRFDNLEDAEEEYGLSVESYLGVSELPDSDQELENVHPDTLEKLDCLSGKQLVAVVVKALTRINEEQINQREDGSNFTTARALLPPRHQGSLRQQLHRPVLGQPPVPHHMQLNP